MFVEWMGSMNILLKEWFVENFLWVVSIWFLNNYFKKLSIRNESLVAASLSVNVCLLRLESGYIGKMEMWLITPEFFFFRKNWNEGLWFPNLLLKFALSRIWGKKKLAHFPPCCCRVQHAHFPSSCRWKCNCVEGELIAINLRTYPRAGVFSLLF